MINLRRELPGRAPNVEKTDIGEYQRCIWTQSVGIPAMPKLY
ncbi:MAG: hypothetical protein ACI97A_000838 [Planctomycetota bacterium]|jgi:hypothetical protein